MYKPRARRRLEAHRRLRARAHAAQDRPAARARRPQGLVHAPVGGRPARWPRAAGRCWRRPRSLRRRAGPCRARWTAPTWTACATSSCARRAGRRGRLRPARAAHGARLPAVELPLAAHQPARRTSTAARREPACASRSRCSTPCARPGRRTKPISVRISATDWRDGRASTATTASRSARAAEGARLRRRSTSRRAGTVPDQQPVYGRMYQVPFGEEIRHEAGIPTMAVGQHPGRRPRATRSSPPAAPTCA